jgi:NTP pyrophosphatase (non-canonical NTP hydrolase)
MKDEKERLLELIGEQGLCEGFEEMLKTAAEEGAKNTKTNHNTELLRRALKKYGFDTQLMLLIEEAGEVVQAASKYINGREKLPDKLIGEIADVDILIEQMKLTWGAEIEEARNKKFRRLEEQLEDR